jgi:molybdopterin converting factor small subunit
LPNILVRYVGLVRRVVPRSDERLQVPATSTLGDVIAALVERHGSPLAEYLVAGGALAPEATILINGRSASRAGGLQAPVGDGAAAVEIVVLAPPVMGGASG